MAKERIPIPDDIAAVVLFVADRTCCLCNTRGRPVQLHHIDDEPSNNEIGNLAVLCLECHDNTMLRGGFGRKLDAAQVSRYRDDWKERVTLRRAEADRLAAEVETQSRVVQPTTVSPEFAFPDIPPQDGLIPYVNSLPDLRRAAYLAATDGWDSGITARMIEASYSIIEVLELGLLRLARYYPYKHFDVEDPREYFSELIASRFRWHGYRHSTGGVGFSGTIVGPLTAGDGVHDVESMVEQLVAALLPLCDEEEFNYERWLERWRSANK